MCDHRARVNVITASSGSRRGRRLENGDGVVAAGELEVCRLRPLDRAQARALELPRGAEVNRGDVNARGGGQLLLGGGGGGAGDEVVVRQLRAAIVRADHLD